MVEALLVVAIVLAALAVRRLGVLLRRDGGDEAAHAYLEARLEDQIRAGMKETARSLHEETAASLARLCDSVLEQINQSTASLEQRLEALAQEVAEAVRTSEERLDSMGREATEDARRTGEALVVALGSLHRSLHDTRREMRELHEQAVRELRRPIRNAVAIRQEIRQARDQQGAKGHGEPSGRSEASAAAPVDEGEGQWQAAVPRPRRLAGLLSRVQRRTRRAAAPGVGTPGGPEEETVPIPEAK